MQADENMTPHEIEQKGRRIGLFFARMYRLKEKEKTL